MEELLIQKYLRGNGENASFQFFRDELHLMIKEAEDGCRVLFKYNQIESPLGNPICQEARGLILDRGCDWEVVSWQIGLPKGDSIWLYLKSTLHPSSASLIIK